MKNFFLFFLILSNVVARDFVLTCTNAEKKIVVSVDRKNTQRHYVEFFDQSGTEPGVPTESYLSTSPNNRFSQLPSGDVLIFSNLAFNQLLKINTAEKDGRKIVLINNQESESNTSCFAIQ